MQDRSRPIASPGTFADRLSDIVGWRHVHRGVRAERQFARGYRFGQGPIELAVTPGCLVEMWQVLEACVAHDRIVIAQAANTGLTGGSTPDGVYDRPIVVLSTTRIHGIHPVMGGSQVICLAGATLGALEAMLAPLGREPHSLIGSSCIGASVIGGVCNSSGGALVRRGPAYTELALYARIDAAGVLALVNNLGIALGDDPLEALDRLERGDFSAGDIAHDPDRKASAHGYEAVVRAVDTPSPARFNADPNFLFEASGSAGRIVVFAVRLDTFARDAGTTTFYVGANAPDDLTRLRRTMLSRATRLPISAEYLHRDAFDLAARYGKDVYWAVRWFGSERLPALFSAKRRAEAAATRIGLSAAVTDRVMQWIADRLPQHLPARLRAFRDRFEHHLILTVSAEDAAEAEALLNDWQAHPGAAGAWFACSPSEATSALLHRFVTAGAAVRYHAIHRRETTALVAIDVALRRDDREWWTPPPAEVTQAMMLTARYGHFFCHVFHLDFLIAPGHDPHHIEERLLAHFDSRGAECPAEHNVGHLYAAKPALAAHYRALDPTNRLNPGIGRTSRARHWQ